MRRLTPQICATMRSAAALALAALLLTVPASKALQNAGANEGEVPRELRAAHGLLGRGLLDEAAQEYAEFLRQNPRHAQAPIARYGLAVCEFRRSQHQQAAEHLGTLVSISEFPFAAEVLVMLGQCQLATHDLPGARRSFELALKSYPDHDLADDALVGLIEALHNAGALPEAAARADEFLARWPDGALAARARYFLGSARLAQKDWVAAAAAFSRVSASSAEKSLAAQAKLLAAQCLDAAGQTSAAEAAFRGILDDPASPHHSAAQLGLAQLLYRGGNVPEAAKLLDNLLEGTAQPPAAALLLRGRVGLEQRDLAAAGGCFRKAAQADPSCADEAAFWAARTTLQSGDARAAAEQLADALLKFPTSVMRAAMQLDRAIALAQVGENAAALQAVGELLAAEQQGTLLPDALHLRAVLAQRIGKYSESAEACEKFLRDHSEHTLSAAVRFAQAENDYLTGDAASALRRYEEFLRKHAEDPNVSNATYRLGMCYFQLGRLEEARITLRKVAAAAEKDPALAAVWLALGDIAVQEGEWPQAEQAFETYVSSEKSQANDEALFKLGVARQRQGDHAGALEAFDRLAREFPEGRNRVAALFEAGQALLALERVDAAAENFERVLALEPKGGVAAYSLNHLGYIAQQRQESAKAADCFARAAELSATPDVARDALFQQGQALLSAGKFAEADAALRRFTVDHPSDPRVGLAVVQRGMALARQDKPAEAIEAFSSIEPERVAALDVATRRTLLYERAWALGKLNRADEAAIELRKLLQSDADTPEGRRAALDLAEQEAAAGRCEQANALLEPIVLLTGEAALPDALRSRALYRLGVCQHARGAWDKSAAALQRFLEEFPVHEMRSSAAFFCGDALRELRRFDSAAKLFDRVVEDSAADERLLAVTLLRLGETAAELQQWERSERAFLRFLQQFPNDESWFQAQFGVGWARENHGRHDEAIRAYRNVVDRHEGPTAARAQFQIGECLFAQKKLEEAVRELLKVDILYAAPEWSAAALFEAGRCFEELGRSVEAREQFRALQDRFGDSRWAQLARERLSANEAGGLPGARRSADSAAATAGSASQR